MTPREVPIHRVDVQGWIDTWNGNPVGTLRHYITVQVNNLNLPDPYVLTYGHDNLPDQVPVDQFILLDLHSYNNVPPGS